MQLAIACLSATHHGRLPFLGSNEREWLVTHRTAGHTEPKRAQTPFCSYRSGGHHRSCSQVSPRPLLQCPTQSCTEVQRRRSQRLTSGRCSDHAGARCSSAELLTLRPTGFAPTFRVPVEKQHSRPLHCKRQLGISSVCLFAIPASDSLRALSTSPGSDMQGATSMKGAASPLSHSTRKPTPLEPQPRFDTAWCLDAAAGLSAPRK